MSCRKNLSGLASYFLGDALGSVRQLKDQKAGKMTEVDVQVVYYYECRTLYNQSRGEVWKRLSFAPKSRMV